MCCAPSNIRAACGWLSSASPLFPVASLGSFGSKLSLNAGELAELDEEFEEITEGEEPTRNESRGAWDAA
jgi:hypothetical protein